MNEVIPEPLPKCFCPVTYQFPSVPGRAVAFVCETSPPLPGSLVIVPNHAPSDARRPTSARCSAQAARWGSSACSLAIQNASTDGCIEETSATEESPCASARKISAVARVDLGTLSKSPPKEAGTPVMR